jgi:hypothetical protein
MDDERRDLVRRLFAALTVQAEKCCELAVLGQSPTLDVADARQLANDAIDIAQLMSVISNAAHALVEDAY